MPAPCFLRTRGFNLHGASWALHDEIRQSAPCMNHSGASRLHARIGRMIPRRALRFRPRHLLTCAVLLSVIAWFLLVHHRPAPQRFVDEETLRTRFPLAYKYIHNFKGRGGGELSILFPTACCATMDVDLTYGPYQPGSFLRNGYQKAKLHPLPFSKQSNWPPVSYVLTPSATFLCPEFRCLSTKNGTPLA